MPFDSEKQRKYLFAKKPEVAKKIAKDKYRYGGTIGGGESVGGTSSDGTENRHVFDKGGVMSDDLKESRMKKGVPGYKARRFMDKLFGGSDEPEKKKEEPKKDKYQMIKGLFKKHGKK